MEKILNEKGENVVRSLEQIRQLQVNINKHSCTAQFADVNYLFCYLVGTHTDMAAVEVLLSLSPRH